jgi:hypothetical protein
VATKRDSFDIRYSLNIKEIMLLLTMLSNDKVTVASSCSIVAKAGYLDASI